MLDLSGDGDSLPQEAGTREDEVLACELLSLSARCSHYGQKEVMRGCDLEKVGFYPVREPDASFTLIRCYPISPRVVTQFLATSSDGKERGRVVAYPAVTSRGNRIAADGTLRISTKNLSVIFGTFMLLTLARIREVGHPFSRIGAP